MRVSQIHALVPCVHNMYVAHSNKQKKKPFVGISTNVVFVIYSSLVSDLDG